MALLLDTCAALWITNGQTLAQAARAEIERALSAKKRIFVSPITAWEVGLLMSKGRISLPDPPLKWFRHLMTAPGMTLAVLDAEILISSSNLPGMDLRDPGDRIIIATAREHGYRIVTRDRRILAYADRGLCRAVAC